MGKRIHKTVPEEIGEQFTEHKDAKSLPGFGNMSLFMRCRSLDDVTFNGKGVAALRNEFGGHAVVKND